MTDISFKIDPEIIIGAGTMNRAGIACKPYGKNVLIVTEKDSPVDSLTAILEDVGIEHIVFDSVTAHTPADTATAIATLAKGACCTTLIGFGGANTQALTRLAAMITRSETDVFDLLDGKQAGTDFIPYIAIPTAMDDPFLFSNSFPAIDHRDRSIKMVKAPRGLCAAVIIDGVSASASAALEGLCFALEAYCSKRANFCADPLLEQAIALYATISDPALDASPALDAAETAARAGLLMALGCALSSPGIGTALAYGLSGRFPVEKTLCSAILLPHVLEKLIAIRPERIARAAALMGEGQTGVSVGESASLALDAVRHRMEGLPARLKDLNVPPDRLIPVLESARNLEFVAFSPWTVTAEEVLSLLNSAYSG
jgi:alcohol dehydrogenase